MSKDRRFNKKIGLSDFKKMFPFLDEKRSRIVAGKIKKIDTAYRQTAANERDEYILNILKLMAVPGIGRTVKENYGAWEKGWSEHLAELARTKIVLDDLKPKYFRGNKYFRFMKDVFVVRNHQIEYELFKVARFCIFSEFLKDAGTICEIGAGSCQNLFLLSDMYPSKNIVGLDWTQATTKIAGVLNQYVSNKISAGVFNMLEPDTRKIPKGAAILTVHALEQIGTGYVKLVDSILSTWPSVVVNYEPIIELYDTDNIMDFLAYSYSVQRKYLNGYLPYLQKLESDGRIKILYTGRPYLGGVLHEASLVVWEPVQRGA